MRQNKDYYPLPSEYSIVDTLMLVANDDHPLVNIVSDEN
jgi:hypothetical protein